MKELRHVVYERMRAMLDSNEELSFEQVAELQELVELIEEFIEDHTADEGA